MGYNFAIIYRSARMMRDVDAPTRRLDKAIILYIIQIYLMRYHNILSCSLAYNLDHLQVSSKPQRVIPLCTSFIPSSVPKSVASSYGSLDASSDSTAAVQYHIAIALSSTPPNSTLHLYPIVVMSSIPL